MKKLLSNLPLFAKILIGIYVVLCISLITEFDDTGTIIFAAAMMVFFGFAFAIAVQILANIIKRLVALFRGAGTATPVKEISKDLMSPTQRKAEIEKAKKSIEEAKQSIAESETARENLLAFSAEITDKQAASEKYIAEAIAKAKREVAAERQSLEAQQDELHEYETALHKTEYRALEWVKLKENKDIAYFEEIKEQFERYKTYSEALPEMDGFQFEEYIGKLLIDNGYEEVQVTQKSQDFGADVVATYGGAKYVFQCKYYTHPVGIEAVQQIFSAKRHYAAHVAVVVTNSVFTKAANILAEEIGVLLWDGKTINEMQKK